MNTHDPHLPAAIDHEHPDVTGGWLRPAVFGARTGWSPTSP